LAKARALGSMLGNLTLTNAGLQFMPPFQKFLARLAWKLYALSIYKQDVGDDPYVADKLRKIFHDSAQKHKKALSRQLFKAEVETVRGGLFEGISLVNQSNWNEAYLLTMYLGQYERQIQNEIEALLDIDFANVIIIGCAEGFFTMGLAKVFPKATIVSVDIDPNTLAICRQNAEINGYTDRCEFLSAADQGVLASYLDNGKPNLVFSDCEGYEFTLLTKDFVEKYPQTSYVCEIHDFNDRGEIIAGKKDALADAFAGTHEVKVFSGEPRDPREGTMLDDFTSSEQWLALDEGRARGMEWLVSTPPV